MTIGSIFWLLAIATLFYFMMKNGGGCCGGHSHNEHDGSQDYTAHTTGAGNQHADRHEIQRLVGNSFILPQGGLEPVQPQLSSLWKR